MSTALPVGFDAEQFKRTTEQQWQAAAPAWYDWTPTLSSWLGPATELMLDMAAVKPGDHVLDIAAGAGEQSVRAAQRVGPGGKVLATDISSNILDFAAQYAQEHGLSNIQIAVMDGENLDVAADSFDAAISRVGLIYFPDQQRALRGILRALKPAGRFATIVYSTPDRNGFFSGPVGVIRKAANLPPPQPGQPGPFSLGADGVLQAVLSEAGFVDVQTQTVSAPLQMASAAECLRFEKSSFGALHQMLSGLSASEAEQAWAQVGNVLQQYENNGSFTGPCELLVAAGTKPSD